jgi:23S rRNA (cytosine1962-C5)-methyltransferase
MKAVAEGWKDYELIDAGNKQRLERWGRYLFVRPDPQAIWSAADDPRWHSADAVYHRSHSGGGQWEFRTALPDQWTVSRRDLTFKVAPTNFKHTGLFPEQAVNWDWLDRLIRNAGRPVKVLNLFAYTGAATMACANAGAAETVHVDAARGMVAWAKENMALNHLEDRIIRFLVDDVMKFLAREQRRGRTYDIILMDPPSYGRGPNGELWKLEDELEALIRQSAALLSSQPLAFAVNSYTTGFSPLILEDLLTDTLAQRFPDGTVTSVELALPLSSRAMVLPCGCTGRFERKP